MPLWHTTSLPHVAHAVGSPRALPVSLDVCKKHARQRDGQTVLSRFLVCFILFCSPAHPESRNRFSSLFYYLRKERAPRGAQIRTESTRGSASVKYKMLAVGLRSPPTGEGKGLQITSAPARGYAKPRFSPTDSFGSAFISMQTTKRILPYPRAAGMCTYRAPFAPRPHLAHPAPISLIPRPPSRHRHRPAKRCVTSGSAGLLRTGCCGDSRPRSFALQLILSPPPLPASYPPPAHTYTGSRGAPSPAVRTRREGRGVLRSVSCLFHYGCTVVICKSLPKRAARPRSPQRRSAPGPFPICISVG